MNRRVLLLIIGPLLLPLGCGDNDGPTGPPAVPPAVPPVPLVLEPSEFCSDHPDAAVATFEDANLEAVIRAALSVGAQEDLTCGLISGLTELDARWSEITSLVGIQNLTGLTALWLHDNSITDIGALSGLTGLASLSLGNNPNLTDIQPLLDNMGLGGGDRVYLRATSVSCTDVTALQAKGVTVQSDCP